MDFPEATYLEWEHSISHTQKSHSLCDKWKLLPTIEEIEAEAALFTQKAKLYSVLTC
jgi:hypothetical protein